MVWHDEAWCGVAICGIITWRGVEEVIYGFLLTRRVLTHISRRIICWLVFQCIWFDGHDCFCRTVRRESGLETPCVRAARCGKADRKDRRSPLFFFVFYISNLAALLEKEEGVTVSLFADNVTVLGADKYRDEFTQWVREVVSKVEVWSNGC